MFSTELAALFVDAHDPHTGPDVATVAEVEGFDDYPGSDAHQLFKKVLPGIINIRTDGTAWYAFRRVQQSYQWESYGPVGPVG
jgi:hypothetical protein